MNYKNKPQNESDVNVNKWNEANNTNLKPMYDNMNRTSEQRLSDQKFIETMMEDSGDKTIAAKKMANRGWYYFFHNVIDTAMFRFNQSWLMDSTYAESYFGFAAIREYQGLNKEAEQFYQLAYKHDNTDTLSEKILHKIAGIKEQQKDTLALITAFRRAYNKFPNDGSATGKLGFFYSAINKPDSAIKYYNITIELDPEYEQTYINRGDYYFQQQKTNEAINDFTTAIKKNTKSISAYANRANALMFDKQYKEAIIDLKQCILLDPKYPDFHNALAECYFQLNQNDKGCEELNIGIKKGGQFLETKKERNCK
ncbi:MAG: tetratricopeptide repeat protein [Bacteroidia bacterium]|nr:tetratricopeptide repeat protein [Bacteroidia bacterium]